MELRRRGMYEAVARNLAARIFAGEIRPGDKLPTEHQLCGEFGVSRTVIRDALRFLATRGMIEARPHSGTSICGIEHWNLLDPQMMSWARGMEDRQGFFDMLMEARNALESEVVAIAALKATPGDTERIRAALEGMEVASTRSPPDFRAFNQADIDYHLAIVDATHNLILRQFGMVIRVALLAIFDLALDLGSLSQESVAAHRGVYEAICRGEPAAARAQLRIITDVLGRNVRSNRAANARGEGNAPEDRWPAGRRVGGDQPAP